MGFPTVTYSFSNSTTADATQVNQNFTDILNGLSDTTKNISVSAGTFAGTLTAQANVTLGNSSANTITLNGSIATNMVFGTTFTYDIGGSTLGVKSLYLGDAGAAARTTRIISATIASSWTLTLPTTAGTSGQFLKTNGSGTTSWSTTTPTIQSFLSGTGTYTTPAGCTAIRITMCGGGGGGGGGSGNGGAPGSGGTGGTTTFGTSLLTCVGGSGGNTSTPLGGAGGTASIVGPAVGLALSGGSGGGSVFEGVNSTRQYQAGCGGVNALGGGGGGGYTGAGTAGAPNTGAGGGGGGFSASGNTQSGPAGGAGGYIQALITGPSATYSYAVGAAGTAGTAGTSGSVGGTGGIGVILVEEFYV